MQLVLSNNRILAHGETFLAMGGVVINTETGAKYENATIAECSGCPSDFGVVGYEYHAGRFVPCAPFGVGTGNVAVYCDDCKTPRDSGIHINDLAKKITVVWENASPDSIFESGTVQLSSDDSDFLAIETSTGLCTVVAKANSTVYISELYKDDDNAKIYLREISISDKATLHFGRIYEQKVNSGGTDDLDASSTSRCKPLKIYGVKI